MLSCIQTILLHKLSIISYPNKVKPLHIAYITFPSTCPNCRSMFVRRTYNSHQPVRTIVRCPFDELIELIKSSHIYFLHFISTFVSKPSKPQKHTMPTTEHEIRSHFLRKHGYLTAQLADSKDQLNQ